MDPTLKLFLGYMPGYTKTYTYLHVVNYQKQKEVQKHRSLFIAGIIHILTLINQKVQYHGRLQAVIFGLRWFYKEVSQFTM